MSCLLFIYIISSMGHSMDGVAKAFRESLYEGIARPRDVLNRKWYRTRDPSHVIC